MCAQGLMCAQLQAQGMYTLAAAEVPRVSPVPPQLRCPRSNEVMSDPVVSPQDVIEQRGPLRKAMQGAKTASGVVKHKTKKTYTFEVCWGFAFSVKMTICVFAQKGDARRRDNREANDVCPFAQNRPSAWRAWRAKDVCNAFIIDVFPHRVSQ